MSDTQKSYAPFDTTALKKGKQGYVLRQLFWWHPLVRLHVLIAIGFVVWLFVVVLSSEQENAAMQWTIFMMVWLIFAMPASILAVLYIQKSILQSTHRTVSLRDVRLRSRRRYIANVWKNFALANGITFTQSSSEAIELMFYHNNSVMSVSSASLSAKITEIQSPINMILLCGERKVIQYRSGVYADSPWQGIDMRDVDEKQRFELEGEFAYYYDVYAQTASDQRRLTQLLSPQAMEALLQNKCSIYSHDARILCQPAEKRSPVSVAAVDVAHLLERITASSTIIMGQVERITRVESPTQLAQERTDITTYKQVASFETVARIVKISVLAVLVLVEVFYLFFMPPQQSVWAWIVWACIVPGGYVIILLGLIYFGLVSILTRFVGRANMKARNVLDGGNLPHERNKKR